jgi:CheY-like chemotaxis protein
MSDRGASLRILAADDNAMCRLLLRAMLETAGGETTLVANGAQAVEATRQAAFDVILLDLHMPVLDGLAAARLIRASNGPNRTVPIIALTADAAPAQIRACLDAGMNCHVEKPVDAARLFAAITEALAPVTQSGQGVAQAKAG